jgi:hypothetical protein
MAERPDRAIETLALKEAEYLKGRIRELETDNVTLY